MPRPDHHFVAGLKSIKAPAGAGTPLGEGALRCRQYGGEPKLPTRDRSAAQDVDAAVQRAPLGAMVLDLLARPSRPLQLPHRDDISLPRGEVSKVRVHFAPL